MRRPHLGSSGSVICFGIAQPGGKLCCRISVVLDIGFLQMGFVYAEKSVIVLRDFFVFGLRHIDVALYDGTSRSGCSGRNETNGHVCKPRLVGFWEIRPD